MGFGETKKYSLRHTLKKNVKNINTIVKILLSKKTCTATNLFRTFVQPNKA